MTDSDRWTDGTDRHTMQVMYRIEIILCLIDLEEKHPVLEKTLSNPFEDEDDDADETDISTLPLPK